MATILGVIPARYASTRFPGKPLIDIRGMSMIERVYRQCQKTESLTEVIVATDDLRIYKHVAAFGGKAAMTREDHLSGTERVGEVAQQYPSYSHFVNIQGDEPFIDPAQIELLCSTLTEGMGAEIATLIHPVTDGQSLLDPNVVKAVVGNEGFALYFSRAPIPFLRGKSVDADWVNEHPFYRHIGIYGFEKQVLGRIPGLAVSPLEEAESLEQLRWLAHGIRIKTAVTNQLAVSIDSPEDLEWVLENWEGE